MSSSDKKTPIDENRWWVDQGKSRERARPEERQAPAGAQFFRSVEGYDQEKARENLTDLNLKLLTQANPRPGLWEYLPLVEERSSPKEIEKIKRSLPLPQNAYGVVVDSGLSLRAVVTGVPMHERVLEFNFIDEASFDCWIRGEWVCEAVFQNKQALLQKAPTLLAQYLAKDIIEQEQFFHAPHSGLAAPARTEW